MPKKIIIMLADANLQSSVIQNVEKKTLFTKKKSYMQKKKQFKF